MKEKSPEQIAGELRNRLSARRDEIRRALEPTQLWRALRNYQNAEDCYDRQREHQIYEGVKLCHPAISALLDEYNRLTKELAAPIPAPDGAFKRTTPKHMSEAAIPANPTGASAPVGTGNEG